MAAVGYLTSSTLIDTVKREAMIPSAQQTFVDADFLAIANQEMRIGIVPKLLEFHQEYFVRDTAPIPLVANQSSYAIPYRAIGGKFRDIYYSDTQGNLMSMTRINPDQRPYFQQSNLQSRAIFFYLQGNEIVLVPTVGPNPTGSLIISYFLRPNELVDASRVGTITNITVGPTTTVFNLNQVPAGFTTTAVYDLMQTKPGHKTLSLDIFATAVDNVNNTITFNNSDIPSSLIVGDYVSFTGECIIPQVPADLHDVLAQRVVLRCLQALGDTQGYSVATNKLQEMEKFTGNLVDNRAEGQAIKLNNLNGVLKSAKARRNRGWP